MWLHEFIYCVSEISISGFRAPVLMFLINVKLTLFFFFLTVTTVCQIFTHQPPDRFFSSRSLPLFPFSRFCTSAKVISSINSYHQLFNWSIAPAPHLLNASLINYCSPQGWEWEGCQPEFSRLRWIFIVFVPRSARAHRLVLKHAERMKLFGSPFNDNRCSLRTVHLMTLAVLITYLFMVLLICVVVLLWLLLLLLLKSII